MNVLNELYPGDFRIIKEHGLPVEMTVHEARKLVDLVDVRFAMMLKEQIDVAQTAVREDSAGIAFVIMRIVP